MYSELTNESQIRRRYSGPLMPGWWLKSVSLRTHKVGKWQAAYQVAEPTIRKSGTLKHQDMHLIKL